MSAFYWQIIKVSNICLRKQFLKKINHLKNLFFKFVNNGQKMIFVSYLIKRYSTVKCCEIKSSRKFNEKYEIAKSKLRPFSVIGRGQEAKKRL